MSRPVILCIDDEDLGLEIRKMVLEREGFTVLTARDGMSGISVFDSEQVDAVVLDYAMPGMDGGQVAAILRQRKPDIPILMLSAYVALPDEVITTLSYIPTLAIRPLCGSRGPYTLKNFNPAHFGGAEPPLATSASAQMSKSFLLFP